MLPLWIPALSPQTTAKNVYLAAIIPQLAKHERKEIPKIPGFGSSQFPVHHQ
jgi:hypothetical protein